MENKHGTLFVVATPIGNLEDITLRAIRVLKEVDLIACEDTRVTKKLLDHYEIKTPTVSYFQHSKLSKIEYLIEQLKAGKDIALVTDAGTPCISDPGQALLQRLKEDTRYKIQDTNINNIQVVPISGPSALTAAASVSGMIEKDFYFAGFLPKKKGRQTEFKRLSGLKCPIILFESAMRLERTLADFKLYFGSDCQVFVAREISKMFEEYWGGSVDVILAGLKSHKLKGEVVLIAKRSRN